MGMYISTRENTAVLSLYRTLNIGHERYINYLLLLLLLLLLNVQDLSVFYIHLILFGAVPSKEFDLCTRGAFSRD